MKHKFTNADSAYLTMYCVLIAVHVFASGIRDGFIGFIGAVSLFLASFMAGVHVHKLFVAESEEDEEEPENP